MIKVKADMQQRTKARDAGMNYKPPSWLTLSFKEVAEVITGTTPATNHSEYYGDAVPFIGPADLGKTEPITQSSKWLSLDGAKQARLLPADAVLVCCIGATIGKVGFSGRELTTNQQINALICDKNVAFPRYVFHYCRTLKAMIRHQGASTTLPLLPKRRFQELEIPIPPIAEQKRIAAILDKAEELRGLRRRALGELDAIVQSIFLEMFGDLRHSDDKEIAPLSSLCHSINDGTHKTPNYVSCGVPFVTVKNIVSGKLDFANTKFITEAEHEELTKRTKPERGDVLVSKDGTIGVPCPVQTDAEFSIFVSVALLKPKPDLIDQEFLVAQLSSEWVQEQVRAGTKGIAIRHLHLVDFKRLKLLLPPLSLQQEFARRVEAIERLKATHRESLAHLDTLFASLQHRAFRGEL